MEGTCECGCGTPTRVSPKTVPRKGWVKGVARRFVHGHNRAKNQFRRQKKAQKFKYAWIAMAALGKPLPPKAVVHHVDGNPRNNARTNLVICENQSYHRLLHSRMHIVRYGGNPNTDKVCSTCHKPKSLDQFHRASATRDGRQSRCKECCQ